MPNEDFEPAGRDPLGPAHNVRGGEVRVTRPLTLPAPSGPATDRTSETRTPRLHRLGLFVARRRRWVLVASLLVTIAAGVIAAGAVGALSLARFEAPGSESDRAGAALAEGFDTGSADLILLVTAKGGDVDEAAVTAAGRSLTRELADFRGVAEAYSYWSRGNPATLRSDDGRHALVVARIPGDATHVRSEILPALTPEFTRDNVAMTVRVGGGEQVFREASEQARRDFVRAELIIFPLVFVLLLVVLRSLLMAALPLAVGLFAMVVALSLLRVPLAFTDVSTFALNLTLAMGLGLGVDYSLFVTYRFREELRAGRPVPDAVARTVNTAGRTVIFSGVTVAASLMVLLVLPFDFLRSFAYAGAAIVTGGVLGAIVVLPAALAAIGHRADRSFRSRRPAAGEHGFWYRATTTVMRRPVAFGGVAVVLLLALGAPFLGLRFGPPDDRILPASASSRQVQEVIRTSFTAEEVDALQVIAPQGGDVSAQRPALERYAADLSRVRGVARVDSLVGSYAAGAPITAPGPDADRFDGEDATWLSVVPTIERLESDANGLVRDVRATEAPFDVLVGGYPAELADYRATVVDRLPLVLGLVLAVTFLILFLMTGSLLLPVKATVLNLLSLSVMFGALVWVFQEGNLSGLLGFTPTGTLEPSIPVLMFCIAYGLSMDYEVFMLSRIKEEYDRTGNNTGAVAAGIQRSAPLITAAAAILALSFAAYAPAGVVFIQMLGVGMAIAIIVDATLIRAILVPAFMRLAGPANWWAPPTLRRLHQRIGIGEAAPPEADRDPHKVQFGSGALPERT